MAVIRGIYRCFDTLSMEFPSLINRMHVEDSMLRQFFEREDQCIRTYSPLAYLVTDENPLQPYADKEAVEATTRQQLPDLAPLNAFSYFFEDHVYRQMNNFPIKETAKSVLGGRPPQVHTAFELNNSHLKHQRLDSDYHGRSLIMAFSTALAQARLNYGQDVSGSLPEPVTVHFVNSCGVRYHFSVFQLNSLDLEGEVKNIFWHQPELDHMFEVCDYVSAKPALEGYNHNVFNKLLAMYLQNAN
jgi:hypothetical protein